MDTPDRLDTENFDIELARRIDAVCRAFENAWHDGASPRIEDLRNAVPEPGRRALLVELIALGT